MVVSVIAMVYVSICISQLVKTYKYDPLVVNGICMLSGGMLTLSASFLFEGLFSSGTFSVILYASGLSLAALNVSKIKTPKLSGNPVNVALLASYTIVMSIIYGWKLL